MRMTLCNEDNRDKFLGKKLVGVDPGAGTLANCEDESRNSLSYTSAVQVTHPEAVVGDPEPMEDAEDGTDSDEDSDDEDDPETVPEVITLVDYSISPFVADIVFDPTSPTGTKAIPEPFPFEWMGSVFMANYVINSILDGCIFAIALMRLQVFFDGLALYKTMNVLAALSWSAKLSGNIIYSYLSNQMIAEHRLFGFFGVTHLERVSNTMCAIFYALSSAMFLGKIASGLGLTTTELMTEVFVEREGVRFLMIAAGNIILCGFALYASLNDGVHTFVTRTGLYMQCWVFAMEFHTYLLTSYVSARELLELKPASGSRAAPSQRLQNIVAINKMTFVREDQVQSGYQ
ncbi:hypothetical protein EDD86DRAFT_245026 [Gorgonomyces haynaldii]|nr:hypothetical protein EDD86DRAFT_245026 [Gorgonomyces haynaldii]